MLCVLASLGYSRVLLSWVSFMHLFTPPLGSHTEVPTFCSPLLSLNTHTLSNTHMQVRADIFSIAYKHEQAHGDGKHYILGAHAHSSTCTVTHIWMFWTNKGKLKSGQNSASCVSQNQRFKWVSKRRTWPLIWCLSALCFLTLLLLLA